METYCVTVGGDFATIIDYEGMGHLPNPDDKLFHGQEAAEQYARDLGFSVRVDGDELVYFFRN